MRAFLMAGLFALSLSAAWAEEATVVEKSEAGVADMAPSAEAGGEAAARDPAKGAVTGLPIPRFVSLKGTEGNARRGPGLTHRIDWVFTREGMPLKVTGEYEHWRRVEDADGAGGWVHYMMLSGIRTVLITQDMAEAHSDPSDTSEVVFQNELNVVGKLVQCLPDWCRIQVEGEKGWVKKEALWGVAADEIFPQ